MFKKIILVSLLAAVSVMASAQYKVASFEKEHCPGFELKYILNTENSTFIYGTFTSQKTCNLFLNSNLSVIQNEEKFKAKNGQYSVS